MMGDDPYGDGGASEFAGGGFMPPPSTPQHGINASASTFSPSAGGRRGSAPVLYPFTVRHFSNCYASTGGDTLAVNGQEINNVVLVGKILIMESRTTDLQLLLDDGTGKIDIRKWHDDQEHERESLSKISTGKIVKVHGVPRKIGNKHTISANSIRPIEDFNEYTCHFLDCIFAFKYSSTQGGGASGSGAQQNPSGVPSSQRPGGQAPGGAYPGSHPGPAQAGFRNTAGANDAFVAVDPRLPLHERVLKFFADNEAGVPAGLHRDTVARAITAMGGVIHEQVMEAIEFLVSEGHLYSTIDDMHFKTLGDNQ